MEHLLIELCQAHSDRIDHSLYTALRWQNVVVFGQNLVKS